MANRRQSIKKIRVDIRRRQNNLRVISELKTVLRKTSKLLAEKKPEIKAQASELFSKLDKAVKKNILHKNRASRLKSRFQQKINSLKLTK
jgi:small subunit ribosomal protein S20